MPALSARPSWIPAYAGMTVGGCGNAGVISPALLDSRLRGNDGRTCGNAGVISPALLDSRLRGNDGRVLRE